MDSTDLRIVLVGKTGAGKSSTGNTILGRNAFPVSPRAQCKEETVKISGKTLTVVDTPGLFDTTLTEEQVMTEISKRISLAAPLVFLVVIHTGRFTKEEQKAVKIIQQMFGEKAACYTMVLFTRGDDLEADKANINAIISANPALSDFIRQCGGGYHVFNNRSRDPAQVRELLEKISIMVRKKERTSYADEMFTETDREKERREDMKRPQSKNPAMVLEEADRWAQGENSAAVSRGAGKAEEEELRIVLVGKTGVGKTSAGNTILGHKAFQSNPSATTECQKKIGQFEGQTLAVIDTPGLLNSRLTEEQVMMELTKCISLADPGPHVILIVLQGGRFIEEDQEIVSNIQKRLGKEAAEFTMVLFTCGDDLKADGDTIEDIISRDEALGDFIHRCNQEYHVLENRDKDPSQVRELLKKINEMVQINKRGYYTTEMFKKAGKAISKEMRQSSMNQERRSQAPRNPSNQIKTDKVGQKENRINCSIM